MSLPSDAAVDAAARRAAAMLASPELSNERLQAYLPLMGQAASPTPSVDTTKVVDQLLSRVQQTPVTEPVKEQLLVLVSFSMPEEALRNLAKQADAAGVPLVLRGLVDNDLQKTLAAIQKVLGDNAGDSTFQIDPTAFSRYAVNDVPTFVLTEADIEQASCEEGTDYTKVRGDVSLRYALERLAEGGNWKTAANRYLSALGGAL